MKIAIIGSGISGLFAAWRLSREHHVTLFEAGPTPGGHVHTVPVEAAGRTLAIDTGFIVFNERTYPHFTQLLADLDIATQPTSMSFSVRCERSRFEYSTRSLAGLLAQPRNLFRPAYWGMFGEIVRFNRLAQAVLENQQSSLDGTIADFLQQHQFAQSFRNWYLLPMGAAIWSCTQAEFLQFPLRFLLTFLSNHGLLTLFSHPQWRVIQGGSRTYVDRLLSRCGGQLQLRLSTPVRAVRRTEDAALVSSDQRSEEPFDQVIFACHSDQALRLLRDPSGLEAETLSGFRYGHNVATLHTNRRLLPRSRAAWASWNYFIPVEDEPRPRVTYCMNLLQGLSTQQTYNVSLNCDGLIDEQQVIKRMEYWHPLFDARTRVLQERHPQLIATNRTSYCGAYWRNGFHEDGLVSALAVCDRLLAAPQPMPAGSR